VEFESGEIFRSSLLRQTRARIAESKRHAFIETDSNVFDRRGVGEWAGESVDERTPQGDPQSSLLSNIVMDEFDWELERRWLRFAVCGGLCCIPHRDEVTYENPKDILDEGVIGWLNH